MKYIRFEMQYWVWIKEYYTDAQHTRTHSHTKSVPSYCQSRGKSQIVDYKKFLWSDLHRAERESMLWLIMQNILCELCLYLFYVLKLLKRMPNLKSPWDMQHNQWFVWGETGCMYLFILGKGRRTSCKNNGRWCNCDKRELL